MPAPLSRRVVLRGLASSLAAAPVLHLGNAQAAEKVTSDDPTAQALGYVESAASLDATKEPAYKDGSDCANCMLYATDQEQDGHAPCGAFGGKLVAGTGWCRAYVKKA